MFAENVILIRAFFLLIQTISCCLKLILAQILGLKFFAAPRKHFAWLLFLLVILGLFMEDLAWIVSTTKAYFIPQIDYQWVLFIIRLSWICNIIMHQAFSLFIESFTNQKKISLHQKVFLLFSSALILIMIGIIALHTHSVYRPPLEKTVMTLITLYECLILLPVSFVYTYVKLRHTQAQKILKTQLKILAQYYIVPYLILSVPLSMFLSPSSSYYSSFFMFFYQISNIMLTLAFAFTIRKIISLRFFNLHPHVHSFEKFNFTHDFKKLLEHLGSATNINEIKILTQRFFSQAFSIPTAHVELCTRQTEPAFQSDPTKPTLPIGNIVVENFIQNPVVVDFEGKNITPNDFLKINEILIYDEIEYDYFHTKNEMHTVIFNFLHTIQADIFIPIYEENIIIAYIIVSQHARPQKLYSDRERDEMVVFASYLGKVINLLQNRNLHELLKQRKEIIDELYLKHQEINKYKESMKFFLQNTQQEIGIIFFKNKRINRANKEAHTILQTDLLEIQKQDAIIKILYQLAKEALVYKSTQTRMTRNKSQKRIVISAIPFNSDDVIVTIHYPEIYDIIKDQIDLIHNPSNWDYLLYLETTESGKLINQLIPSKGKLFLNFKIDLLKFALSKKALLLDAPEDDLRPLIEILHHISLRETLYILELEDQTNPLHYATKLFGINYLYGNNSEPSLLEKLNKVGTLCIKNIALLPLEAQNNLAQFIRYGFYNIFKSEKRVQSDVRIICTTHKNLEVLVEEGKFSKALLHELKKTTLILPSLLTLPDIEINQLVDGFTELALSKRKPTDDYTLSNIDRSTLTAYKPVSLQELKNKVQQIMGDNHKKEVSYETSTIETNYSITDTRLQEIALLGKHALKDPRLLNILWNKFQNQNQIALFLGVNRSSVNRRCKEYNII